AAHPRDLIPAGKPTDYRACVILSQVAEIFGPRSCRAAIEAIESRAARSAYSTRSCPSSSTRKFLILFMLRLLDFTERGLSGCGRVGREPGPSDTERKALLTGGQSRGSDYSAAVIFPHVAAIFGPRSCRAAIDAIESRAARSAYST